MGTRFGVLREGFLEEVTFADAESGRTSLSWLTRRVPGRGTAHAKA